MVLAGKVSCLNWTISLNNFLITEELLSIASVRWVFSLCSRSDGSLVSTVGSRIDDCQYPLHDNLPIRRMVMFGLLYGVQNNKTISIGFPVFILLCIPVRWYLLPRIFDEDELTDSAG
jgi:hypothetical protein